MRKALVLIPIFVAQIAIFAYSQTPSINSQQRTAAYFEFHSNFWVNLHQTFFFQATIPLGAKQGTPENTSVAWALAREFYRKHFSGQSLLFDPRLVQINDWLAKQPDDGSHFDPSGLSPELAKVLQSVAPEYQAQWKQSDHANRQWINNMEPRILALAPIAAPRIEADLGISWPGDPIRVDVSFRVRELGAAYTTDHPPHTTISSQNDQNHGNAGLEILFHEASHTMSRKIEQALNAECGSQKKDCGDLWHALLFYTVGDVVKHALPQAEGATFVPYAYRYGLYTHGKWKNYRIVLEKDWQPYLDKKIEFHTAIRALVSGMN